MIKYFLYKEDAYNHTYGESVMIDCICPDCGNITYKIISNKSLYYIVKVIVRIKY